jgi:hypothetical protein
MHDENVALGKEVNPDLAKRSIMAKSFSRRNIS